MKSSVYAKSFAASVVIICLLVAPVPVLAKKGDKNYKRGLQHEVAQQWERAAQEFALAVAADPANVEFQLHYRRSLFNASQMFMQRGRTLAEQRDYVGAYNAFRQSYGYDPVNELAQSEMQRMLRLQQEKEGITGDVNGAKNGGAAQGSGDSVTGARITPTSYQEGAGNGTSPRGAQPEELPPTRSEQLRIVKYDDLELSTVIRNLAQELDLNVVFDSQFPTNRKITVNWKQITAARALDLIFLSNNLFFQKLDRRSILVADQSKRNIYQQLVLRTFYLENMAPEEAQKQVQQALPPSPGRGATIVTTNKTTNSITVRDTPENVRLIGELLRSVDKSRAEIVMDVNIYEVSRSDLLQFGNQIGRPGDNGVLSSLSLARAGDLAASTGSTAAAGLIAGNVATAYGAAILLPASNLSALQRRDNTRLVFSTQVHAFDGEKSTTRVGQRVPVQTGASFPYYGGQTNPGTGGTTATGGTGFNPGIYGAGSIPTIQYEQTGLIMDFTPQVFPNQDVQVKMKIESKDVLNSSLTPTFTERVIEGTARVQNNRTMMLASIAQNKESNGRQGLPILGLIPVLGRLFTAPRRDNTQSDIVITVTPRVLRAPAITPRDEELRPSGTLQTPTTESLALMVQEAEREEQLVASAAARRSAASAANLPVQVPDVEATTYVPAPKIMMGAANASSANNAATTNALNTSGTSGTIATAGPTGGAPGLLPTNPIVLAASPAASTIVKELLTSSPASSATTKEAKPIVAGTVSTPAAVANLHLLAAKQEMRFGEKRNLMVALKTGTPLSMAVAKLRFNPHVVAIRSVVKGNLFAGTKSEPMITHAVDQKGGLLLSIAPGAGGTPMLGAGVLFVIEVEAIGVGESELSFGTGDVHFVASDGRNVSAQLGHSYITVKQ